MPTEQQTGKDKEQAELWNCEQSIAGPFCTYNINAVLYTVYSLVSVLI